MARNSLLAVLAALVLAGGVATAVVRVNDDSADQPVVAATDPTTSESPSVGASTSPPAGSDDVDPAPDASDDSVVNVGDAGASDDPEPAPEDDASEGAAPDDDASEGAAPDDDSSEGGAVNVGNDNDSSADGDDDGQAVAIDEMPNTGGGLPALLGAGVALGAAASRRRR